MTDDVLARLEAEEAREKGDADAMEVIRILADERAALVARAEELTAELKDVGQRIRDIEENKLVTALDAVGMDSFTLDNGMTFTLDRELHMSIPKKNTDECARWLTIHQYGDIVSREVRVKFGAGEENEFVEFAKVLDHTKACGRYETTRSMHTGRVKSLFKGLLDEGKDVPLKLFGGYLRRYVNIKTK